MMEAEERPGSVVSRLSRGFEHCPNEGEQLLLGLSLEISERKALGHLKSLKRDPFKPSLVPFSTMLRKEINIYWGLL